MKNSLLHAVLLDYLSECGEEDRNEIITAYLPNIAALASTKDGARAAIVMFWHSATKDRRVSSFLYQKMNLKCYFCALMGKRPYAFRNI